MKSKEEIRRSHSTCFFRLTQIKNYKTKVTTTDVYFESLRRSLKIVLKNFKTETLSERRSSTFFVQIIHNITMNIE